MPDQWPLLLLVGAFAGVLSGMFGIGGGIVIVPALTVFLGFTTVQATSTSLAALLMPVGIFAVLQYWRARKFDIRASAIIGVGLALTSYFGAQIALALADFNPALFRQLYGLFALWMGWRFSTPRQWVTELRAGPVENKAQAAQPPQDAEPPANATLILLLIGLGAGVLSGMMGIGGGIVIVPALVGLLHFEQKKAIGTSLGALLLPVGLPGVLAYNAAGVLNIPVAAIVSVALLVGAILGARIALGLSSKTVKRLYGLFLIVVAMRFLFGG